MTAVAGSLNTELVVGPVEPPPEWGKQTCVTILERRHIGSALPVPLFWAKLGLEAVIVGTVGDCEPGRLVWDNLRRHGLLRDPGRSSDRPSGVASEGGAVDSEAEESLHDTEGR